MVKPTYQLFLLDETGSMESIRDDTIGGFNAFLDGLDKDADIRITLITWDTNAQITRCAEKPHKEVPRLTRETYHPGAGTPLIDVVYNGIKKVEEKIAGKEFQVHIVVQTDGHENSSVQHTHAELMQLVKDKTAEGWLFTFLGAGIDAFDIGQGLGFQAANILSNDRSKMRETYAAAARSTSAYAVTGQTVSAAFTDQERESTGGHMPGQPVVSPVPPVMPPVPPIPTPVATKQEVKPIVNLNW